VTAEAAYFVNHARKDRFPWSLYHQPLAEQLARIIAKHETPRVLVVGCGLEPTIAECDEATFFGCDLDPRAIEACKRDRPEMADRLAVCPSPLELPRSGAFAEPFDVVLAKEVIEHLDSPAPWAQLLASRVRVGGSLALSTPNYGLDSSLGVLESTVLEWIARRDGYSRRHIHPSKFNARSLAKLDVGVGMRLVEIEVPWTRWTLLGHWERVS
jgi:2-polyprenyl-3-methyl-5-hydroxy-6-metoxy-1,4-benzoquinol methylase